MSNPFDESDDDAEPSERAEGLIINKNFAEKFEAEERRKELARSKDLLEADDESDSESEDDEGELISASLDIEILKVINKIRKKDPKIYDRSTTWFEQQEEQEGDEDDGDGEPRRLDKKKRYKDVLREQLLSHGADVAYDESSKGDSSIGRSTDALAYDEEQQKIRRDFLKSVGDDDDDDEGDDVFRVRTKSAAELAEDDIELKKAMAEMMELGAAEAAESTEKSDAFLLDYISKQSWKSKQKYSMNGGDEVDSDEGDYEEDEEELDKVDLFEHKYNFRFEELQGVEGTNGEAGRSNVIGLGLQSLQVTGHARNVEGSVRRIDEKRKNQREGRKESKEKEKRQKEAELKRLKSLKSQELQERLRQICEVSGLGEGGLSLEGVDLDEDWDPEKYEAMMQSQFGEEYYGDENDGEFANSKKASEWDTGNDGDDAEGEGGEDEEYYDEDAAKVDDDEFDDGNGQKQSKSKVVSGMLDELYKLDYEDIVAGMPCRFKYRQVEKEDFGLTAEEILLAEDGELNQFVSLKKISAYAESYGVGDQARKVAKKRKRFRVAIKDRLAKEAEEAEAAGLAIKGLKKKPAAADLDKKSSVESEEVTEEVGEEANIGKKRRRRKLKEGASAPSNVPAVSPAIEEAIVEVESPPEETHKKKKHDKGGDVSSKAQSKVEKETDKGKSREFRKSKKRSAMPIAPTSKSTSSTKVNGASENKQRRASLYK